MPNHIGQEKLCAVCKETLTVSHELDGDRLCPACFNYVTVRVSRARAAQREEISPRLHEIKTLAATIQKNVCCYGTTHGDQKRCDCKYMEAGNRSFRSSVEETGCCEARQIIDIAARITNSEETNRTDGLA